MNELQFVFHGLLQLFNVFGERLAEQLAHAPLEVWSKMWRHQEGHKLWHLLALELANHPDVVLYFVRRQRRAVTLHERVIPFEGGTSPLTREQEAGYCQTDGSITKQCVCLARHACMICRKRMVHSCDPGMLPQCPVGVADGRRHAARAEQLALKIQSASILSAVKLGEIIAPCTGGQGMLLKPVLEVLV